MSTRAAVATADQMFDGIAEQMGSYEIISAEDRRARYFFFAGDSGEAIPKPGGMRVQSPCVYRQTFYRCMITPVVTVRRLELTNLIPAGAEVPGSRDRVKQGCSEYWMNAGPEAATMLAEYGSPQDMTRNWGLIEIAPEILRGLDWDKEVKPLRIQQVFFPDWPNDVAEKNADVAKHIEERIEFIRTSNDPLIVRNRELYLAVGANMLDAVDAADRYQRLICNRANQAVSQPFGNDFFKAGFDGRDNAYFERTGLVKNTEAMTTVAGRLQQQTGNLDGATLEAILAKVVPAQQPAFSPEDLARALALAMRMVQQPQTAAPVPEPPVAPPVEKKKEDTRFKPNPKPTNGDA